MHIYFYSKSLYTTRLKQKIINQFVLSFSYSAIWQYGSMVYKVGTYILYKHDFNLTQVPFTIQFRWKRAKLRVLLNDTYY